MVTIICIRPPRAVRALLRLACRRAAEAPV